MREDVFPSRRYYCLDCDWSTNTEDSDNRHEVNECIIEHATVHHHDVDSEVIADVDRASE